MDGRGVNVIDGGGNYMFYDNEQATLEESTSAQEVKRVRKGVIDEILLEIWSLPTAYILPIAYGKRY